MFSLVTTGAHAKGMLSLLAIRDLSDDWLEGVGVTGSSTRGDILGGAGAIADMNEGRECLWDEVSNDVPVNCLSLVLLLRRSDTDDVCCSVLNGTG